MNSFFRQPKPAPNPDYLRRVRELPCAACGAPAPSEAHHCRDTPPYDEQGAYKSLPGYGQKSADEDAIPLCGPDGCHKLFHMERAEFYRLYGKDYSYIALTRANLTDLELDF